MYNTVVCDYLICIYEDFSPKDGNHMTKAEIRLFDFIRKHILFILFILITAAGFALRIFGMDFESVDYTYFLKPWWEAIKAANGNVLSQQIGNYNIPYQIITYLMTLLPITSLTAYKVLSIIFDCVLAVSVALLARELCGKRSKLIPLIAYGLTFCSITVIMNSAFWAQCDSIYVSFIILAMYFAQKDKTVLTFIMLGLSFSFKLQAVFILPFFFIWYLLEHKASLLHFLIIPAVDIVLCLPAIFAGRNPLDIITIYLDQTDYGKQIQMNFPNIYAFMCEGSSPENYKLLKTFSIVLTVLILAAVFCVMIYKRTDLSDKSMFLWTAIWSVFTCLIFLSSMHERYSYLLDVLLIIYAVVFKKHIWAAVAANLVSLRGYCYFLFSYEVLDLKWSSIIYLALYTYVTYILIRDILKQDKKSNDAVLA